MDGHLHWWHLWLIGDPVELSFLDSDLIQFLPFSDAQSSCSYCDFWHWRTVLALTSLGPSSFWREDPLSLWLGSFPRLIWFATCWTGLLFAFGRNSFLGGIKMKSWYSGWSSLWALEYLKQKTDKNEQKKHFIKNFYHNFLNQLYSNKSYLKFFKFFG